MPWLGIWFEPDAREDRPRSPEWFQGLLPPRVYPYAHSFVQAEVERLRKTREPGACVHEGSRVQVYYSLTHDGELNGLDQQGCHILRWLFSNFSIDPPNRISACFSEVPVVIHEAHPARAAAMGNALTLLRFLGAQPDQAIAKILLQPWIPLRGGPRLSALEYEKRVLDFLHGELYYPEDVTLFDVLERRDLKGHRALGPCCETQIGFIRSLLEWIDECWPNSKHEAAELEGKLRNSLADEAEVQRR